MNPGPLFTADSLGAASFTAVSVDADDTDVSSIEGGTIVSVTVSDGVGFGTSGVNIELATGFATGTAYWSDDASELGTYAGTYGPAQ